MNNILSLNVYRQIQGKIINIIIRTRLHSSFCVLKSMLSECRPHFFGVPRTTQKAQPVSSEAKSLTWKQRVPPKRLGLRTKLHSAPFQKTASS